MSNIPITVINRLKSTVPKFQKILITAKERDVNESDTVTIIIDMLEEIFGFDKYSDITREYNIQGTYCDLAIKINKNINYLIEVKAVGLALNDKHLKQAVNYASREGIKWVVLTNGIQWEIHRVHIVNKVINQKVFCIDFIKMNPKEKEQQELLFLLCRRGVQKNILGDYFEYKKSVNEYTIAALLLTESIAKTIRKKMRDINPGIKVSTEEINHIIKNEVIKREALESEAGIEAIKQVNKFIKKQARIKTKSKSTESEKEDAP